MTWLRAWLERCWNQPDRMLAYYRRVWWPDGLETEDQAAKKHFDRIFGPQVPDPPKEIRP